MGQKTTLKIMTLKKTLWNKQKWFKYYNTFVFIRIFVYYILCDIISSCGIATITSLLQHFFFKYSISFQINVNILDNFFSFFTLMHQLDLYSTWITAHKPILLCNVTYLGVKFDVKWEKGMGIDWIVKSDWYRPERSKNECKR